MNWWGHCNGKTAALAALVFLSARVAGAAPVLVELFTSEGCSSCPPADALLRTLERDQVVPGATVIALSEHVDYWNHLGWRDPFSSPQMSSRQQAYTARFRGDGPYTPQMVVDGTHEFVGSDRSRAQRAIAAAAAQPKLGITAGIVSPGILHVTIPAGDTRADVLMAAVYDPEPSAVARGENSGRRLVHVSVVKSLQRVGEILRGKGFDGDVRVPDDGRVVVFVQERGQGRVLGAAAVNVRHSAGIVARWSPQK